MNNIIIIIYTSIYIIDYLCMYVCMCYVCMYVPQEYSVKIRNTEYLHHIFPLPNQLLSAQYLSYIPKYAYVHVLHYLLT